jgi:hypothetical protein
VVQKLSTAKYYGTVVAVAVAVVAVAAAAVVVEASTAARFGRQVRATHFLSLETLEDR